jgi:hypothetical protein
MSYARSSILFLVGPAVAVALLMTVSTASAETNRVVVRVYETAVGDLALRTAAIQTAAEIVKAAGIMVEWHDCTESGRRPVCQDARRAGNFIARIMPVLKAGAAPRRESIEALGTSGDTEPLGFAVVDPGTHTGKMATAFQNQIDSVARRTGVARSELLGRALAHEIGHLLLGVRGHSRTGIMRAMWTDEELTRGRAEDWLFAPGDSQRLQQTLIEP